MNRIYIGTPEIEQPSGGFLYIGDTTPKVPDKRRPKIFDPFKHHFNPLEGMTKRKARELARNIYAAVSPEGENTLTVRNGRRELAVALAEGEWLDKLDAGEDARAAIDDLLFTDEMKSVLCKRGKQFVFDPETVILARIDRSQLDEQDTLALGLLLMSHYRGQLVVPDFGFYGRDIHSRLIQEERLIAGVNFLDELTPKLRQRVLLIPEKIAEKATYEDAETLAKYAGLAPRTNEFIGFVESAMG